jgi:hypothetical protein
MGKFRHIVSKLLIIFISVFFIDGGKSFLLVSNNLQVIINKDHTNDLEIPQQNHLVNFSTDEKWIESFIYDFSCFNFKSVKFSFILKPASQEFPDSIWQPPKFV